MENFLPKVWSCRFRGQNELSSFFAPSPPLISVRNARIYDFVERVTSKRTQFFSKDISIPEARKKKEKKKIDGYQLVSEVPFFNTAKWIIALLDIVSKNHSLSRFVLENIWYPWILIFSYRYFYDTLCIYLVNISIVFTTDIRK